MNVSELWCPFCGLNGGSMSAVADWQAQSLDPADKANTAPLVEVQCYSKRCEGRSFWVPSQEEGK